MRERRSHEQRRGEITDAAFSIITRSGITALTVASLAKEVGLTGGALYRHFPSSDAILEAVVARIVDRLDTALPDPSLDPLAWLERFVDLRSHAAASGLMRFILSEQVAKALPKPASAVLRSAIASTLASIERALVAGQEQGVIRRDLSVADLLPIVVGSVQVLALARSGEPFRGIVDGDRVGATLRALLTEGTR